MKNILTKTTAIVSAVSIIAFTGVGVGVYAANSRENLTKTETANALANTETTNTVKDETVYVLASADGSVQKIIVSDWIKNASASASVADKSELSNIENVKGDEGYTLGSDNARVWDAQGKDIYYQGNIEKELPVTLKVTYKLDGKSVSADELKGKSGKVTIKYEYKNNQYENVTIDGKTEKIYVPFAMLTGMLLDNNVFSNVEVSNGKLLNDGNRTVVCGLAFPGLQENLNINKEKLEIPDYVEINADVKNFEMTNTVTVAVNDIFGKINTDEINSVSDIEKSINELTSAMSQLTDGSSQLYSGLCTLLEKSGELVKGIDKLALGASALKDGSLKLKDGTASVKDGMNELYSGLSELEANNAALNAGAETTFKTLLKTVQDQLGTDELTIANYKEKLTKLAGASTNEDKEKLTKLANETLNKKLSESGVGQEYYAAVKYMLYERAALGTDEAMVQVSGILKNALTFSQIVDAMGLTNASSAQQVAAVAGYLASKEGGSADQYTQQAVKMGTDAQTVKTAATNAATEKGKTAINAFCLALAQKTVTDTVNQLDEYNKFYVGIKDYTQGVKDSKTGAGKLNLGATSLKSGADELYKGTCELYDGILQLKDGAPALVSGVTQLRDGSMKLSDGLKEFNEKGVQKIVDAIDGDLGGLVTRFKATADVAKNYKSFSGIADNTDGKVKFIYRTDAIENK